MDRSTSERFACGRLLKSAPHKIKSRAADCPFVIYVMDKILLNGLVILEN